VKSFRDLKIGDLVTYYVFAIDEQKKKIRVVLSVKRAQHDPACHRVTVMDANTGEINVIDSIGPGYWTKHSS